MDKLAFRRTCLEDPHTTDPCFREAWRQDPELEAFRRSVLKIDDQLCEALNVEVPPGFAARLELRRLLDESSSKSAQTMPSWFRPSMAIAASLMLAMSIGLWVFNSPGFLGSTDSEQDLASVLEPGTEDAQLEANANTDEFTAAFAHINLRLASAVIEHSGHELNGDLSVTPEKLDQFSGILAEYQIPLSASEIGARFVERCPVLNKQVVHALLTGVSSDVTLVYLPHHLTELNTGIVVGDEFVYVQPIGSGALVLSSQSQADLDHSLSQITESWHNEPRLLALAF
ncbi:MAG: DUF3379 family protein [Proteobacteria bacterium]|jgi:hypothetical protein|nr:DUF3379 family protein [Pseudomonadota bacterium]